MMPKKSDRTIYDEIYAVRSDVRCLFMSGHSEDAVHWTVLSRWFLGTLLRGSDKPLLCFCSSLFLFFLCRHGEYPVSVNIFKIEPPLFGIVGFAIPEEVISFDGNAPGKG
jgi:hypothetical protein